MCRLVVVDRLDVIGLVANRKEQLSGIKNLPMRLSLVVVIGEE